MGAVGFVTESTTFAEFFLTQVKQLGISVQRMLSLMDLARREPCGT